MDGAKTVLIDADGCLTDGKQYIDHQGEKVFLAFHSRDVRAIRELVANGYYVAIVTANESESIKTFADKVGADHILTRDKGAMNMENYIAVGDDAWDIPMLQKAKQCFCPADADYMVRMLPGVKVLETKGGNGVIAELTRILL
jgi:3-deoxy-D-manno-octulosonate 8-phosphate phosphatase (KDO 8-P phosphatase)